MWIEFYCSKIEENLSSFLIWNLSLPLSVHIIPPFSFFLGAWWVRQIHKISLSLFIFLLLPRAASLLAAIITAAEYTRSVAQNVYLYIYIYL